MAEAAERRGRPSKYKPEFVKQAGKLTALGATDREVAEFFEIDERTLHRWKHEHPDFCHALNVGKEPADARVKQSLFRRAVGYTFDSEKVFQFQGQIVRAEVVEHVPPDVTAGIFWLKNRQPDEWRQAPTPTDPDKSDTQVTITGGLPDE